MLKITELTHLLLKEIVQEGDYCVDATCGNGHDTLFLAKLVGTTGHVDSYDIQDLAIDNAKTLTQDFTNISFVNTSHENIKIKNCKVVLFNLGYLPHGDKKIHTTKESTIKALDNLLDQIADNPLLNIMVVIYPGHDEGLKESMAIDEWSASLDSATYLVMKYQPTNQHRAPYLVTINKKTH